MSGILGTIILIALAMLIFGGGSISWWKETLREKHAANQAAQKLSGKKLVVAIRTKDGKRNYWETLFIKQLMDLGATILNLSPECGNNLWDGGARDEIPEGVIIFVGTTWESSVFWRIDGKFLPEKSREIAVRNEPILAPFFSAHNNVNELRGNIVECVSKFF